MKKWIAKKLLNLLRIEWRKSPIEHLPEIRVFLGDTQILLLRASYNTMLDSWDFERYN